MVANPKQELHTLINQLSDDDAAATLAYARRLRGVHSSLAQPQSGVPSRSHTLPTLHHAPPVSTINDLRAPIFSLDETVEEFDVALRRWRESAEHPSKAAHAMVTHIKEQGYPEASRSAAATSFGMGAGAGEAGCSK